MMITDTATISPSRLFSEVAVPSAPRRLSQQTHRFANRVATTTSPRMTVDVVQASDAPSESIAASNQKDSPPREFMFLFGGTLSPADLTYLDEILGMHGLRGSILAGVDGEANTMCQTPTRDLSSVRAAELSNHASKLQMAAAIAEHMGVKCQRLAMPIGIARTDDFLHSLRTFGATTTSSRLKLERDRLVLRLASHNSVLADRRVAVYGEEIEFVVGVVSLLLEAGMLPVLCGSRMAPQQLRRILESTTPELQTRTSVVQAEGFRDLQADVLAARPDALIANRDAREFAERMGIPFVCAGRPLCNHNGDFDIVQIGYRGAMQLLDRLELAIDRPCNRHRSEEKR
ncbi:MAG: hypothetical protein KJ000_02695 [Pirellulaceae bacterium]|nr:hypothetical protein [Pirellulaceae bacterium]